MPGGVPNVPGEVPGVPGVGGEWGGVWVEYVWGDFNRGGYVCKYI